MNEEDRSMPAQLDRILGKLDKIETWMAKTDGRLEKIETDIGHMRPIVDALAVKFLAPYECKQLGIPVTHPAAIK